MIPIIKKDDCLGCEKCSEVCPPQAITVENNVAELDTELCEECGFCAAVCPVHAIHIPFPLSGEGSSEM